MFHASRFFLATFSALFLLLAGTATAQTSRRVALVIGNQDYRHADKLANPVADARAIAAQLRSRYFEVFDGYDLDRGGMNRLFRQFEATLGPGAIAVVYFAGHGVQVAGGNILVPVDMRPQTERDLLDDGIPLYGWMERMGQANSQAGGGLNLLIIDACRDNPFRAAGGAGRALGATRGLARETATGTIVLYAAGANQQALDRLGPEDRNPNGVFTRTLLQQMQAPGVGVKEMMGRVQSEVAAAARRIGHTQLPALYLEAEGDFVFTPAAAPLPNPVTPTPPVPPVDQRGVSADREMVFWQSALQGGTRGDFEAYLQVYPAGTFAPLARNRLAALAPPPAPAPAPPQQPAALVPPPTPPGPVARDDSAFTAAERRNALQALRVLGHWRGPVDGQPFGQAVRTAIRHWQGFEALPETGTLDDRGLARLVEAQEVLAALLERPARSPAGVAASSVAGGADRYARGWAAERGAGAPANLAEAVYWYGLAAQDGEVRAFTQLGLLLVRGQGVSAADPIRAATLWQVAAAAGDATAAFNLGTLRERGMGWPANREAAIFWYTLAAPQNAAAAQGLRRLGR